MLVYSDTLARALSSHVFKPDEPGFQVCSVCGYKMPVRRNLGGYEVAKIPTCPGPQEPVSDD